MKTINFYKLITLLFAITVMVSCIKDDDYDTPNLEIGVPDLSGTQITIGALKQLLIQEQTNNGNDVFTIEDDLYTTGFVISNDEFGNFFEEIIIQNAPSSPTIGLRVLVDVNPLYIYTEFGRKTHIQLKGLTVGYANGILTVGILNGSSFEKIGASQLEDYIKRDVNVEEITPLPMSISDFSADKTNLYIRLNDMQFNRNDALGDFPKTYAAEEEDDFDGERALESCADGLTTILSTSTFADFKAVTLSSGRGTIDGILTYNFFGETFNIVVNSPATVNFDSTDRCDPSEVDCGIASSTGANELFSEFFETFNDGDVISGNGWTNYTEAGSRNWEAFFSDSANGSLGISATIGSYQSNDASTIGWLIMPAFNFDAQEGETLNFKTSNSFADGSTLELLFSNDWDGNPANITAATWDLVPAAYIVQDDDNFSDWFSSGNVSLDCITGTGYIGFRYQGSGDENFDGSYELDEIVVNYEN